MDKSTEIQNLYRRISCLKVDIENAIHDLEDGFSKDVRRRLLNALERDYVIREAYEKREKNDE